MSGFIEFRLSWLSQVASILALLIAGRPAAAISLNPDDADSIKAAAGTASYGMMKYYNANQTGGVPGNLPDPYYWWEAGAMMMNLITYWSATGDSTYNAQVSEAILWQSAENGDFMTRNQTRTEGNDDQGFWAFAAMEAAELNFPDPTDPNAFSWLSLAQGVFNTQVPRWDLPPSTCGGGLKWQIFPFNAGFNYKNSISNGCFFALGARLARYTGNQTYADWADKAYTWMDTVGLIDDNFNVFDGADDKLNCTEINLQTFSYANGVMLHGAAFMYNHTRAQKWRDRVDGHLKAIANSFFPDGKNQMTEIMCESHGTCNYDMRSFKAYLSRWLSVTAQLAPWTAPTIKPLLVASAQGAAASCSGPSNACGLTWSESIFDSSTGPGEQMSAMSVFSSLMAFIGPGNPPPVTADTGGTSQGDPNAGGTDVASHLGVPRKITTADRAGAAIMTIVVVGAWVGGMAWMVW